MINVAALQARCQSVGIQVERHTDFHYRVSARYEVNVYPTTDRVHMKGGQRSGTVSSIEEILELARGEAAVDVGDLARRRQMTSEKRKLWNHSHICGLCKKAIDSFEDASVDHIIPRAKGGSNRFDNLQLACIPCNSNKGCSL